MSWRADAREELPSEARPSRPAIEFIDVHKAFGTNAVLNGVSFGIPAGRISMIMGPSGTGKSVCINHMVGLMYPDSGDVVVLEPLEQSWSEILARRSGSVA